MVDAGESVGQMAAHLVRLHSAFLKTRLQPLGLSPAQYQALAALDLHGEQTQRALAGMLAVEQATMANTLSRMERDGLIERKPHPDDGRAQLIRLTERARERIEPARQAARAADQVLLDGLPMAEQALFVSMLGRVNGAMEKVALNSPG